jgi:hypothetical protein
VSADTLSSLSPMAALCPGRYDAAAMSAALVLIIVVALLCIALVAIFGCLWAALHFGIGEDDDD